MILVHIVLVHGSAVTRNAKDIKGEVVAYLRQDMERRIPGDERGGCLLANSLVHIVPLLTAHRTVCGIR